MSNQHQQHGHKMSQDDRNKGGHNPQNFKNDPERAREAGHEGGKHAHGGKREKEEE